MSPSTASLVEAARQLADDVTEVHAARVFIVHTRPPHAVIVPAQHPVENATCTCDLANPAPCEHIAAALFHVLKENRP